MTTWTELAEHLYQDLLRLAAEDTIVIHAGTRYVQLRQHPSFLHAEASSNEFLHGDARLTAVQEQMLTDAGWVERQPGMVNWNLDMGWPANAARTRAFANTLVLTLETIFGARRPAELTLEAWNDNSNKPFALAIAADLEGAGLPSGRVASTGSHEP